MSAPRDPDLIVADWLDDGPLRLPDQTRRAIIGRPSKHNPTPVGPRLAMDVRSHEPHREARRCCDRRGAGGGSEPVDPGASGRHRRADPDADPEPRHRARHRLRSTTVIDGVDPGDDPAVHVRRSWLLDPLSARAGSPTAGIAQRTSSDRDGGRHVRPARETSGSSGPVSAVVPADVVVDDWIASEPHELRELGLHASTRHPGAGDHRWPRGPSQGVSVVTHRRPRSRPRSSLATASTCSRTFRTMRGSGWAQRGGLSGRCSMPWWRRSSSIPTAAASPSPA